MEHTRVFHAKKQALFMTHNPLANREIAANFNELSIQTEITWRFEKFEQDRQQGRLWFSEGQRHILLLVFGISTLI